MQSGAMDGSNVNEVVTAFEELPKGYGRHLEMKLLMRSWAAIDPEAASRTPTTLWTPKAKEGSAYPKYSPDGQTATRKEPLPGPRQTVITPKTRTTPCWSVSSEDWRKTTSRWRTSSSENYPREAPVGRHRLFLLRNMPNLAPEEAIKWAENFPTNDSRMRETILGQLGARLAREDLAGTADWVSRIEHDKGSQRITDNLLMQWVSKDAPAASEWVLRLEDSQKRTYAMKQLTARWSLTDPVSTAKWLNTLPASPEMDSAVGEFVSRISTRDPEGAMGWAMTIQDPAEKSKALNRALGAWEKIDPAKALKLETIQQLRKLKIRLTFLSSR